MSHRVFEAQHIAVLIRVGGVVSIGGAQLGCKAFVYIFGISRQHGQMVIAVRRCDLMGPLHPFPTFLPG